MCMHICQGYDTTINWSSRASGKSTTASTTASFDWHRFSVALYLVLHSHILHGSITSSFPYRMPAPSVGIDSCRLTVASVGVRAYQASAMGLITYKVTGISAHIMEGPPIPLVALNTSLSNGG